jgi:sensor c-di-GMP phosphodiesterase-like protein
MINLFHNLWIVGIGGGIISGVIVAVVVKFIFGKRESKEYQQKVAMANHEIIYALRPSIAEKVFPSVDIIHSILVSTSQKYGVDKYDLYTLNSICDDLIKEIMADTFLASKQKVEFCELVNNFRTQGNDPKKQKITNPQVITIRKGNSAEFISLTMGLMTTMMAALLTVFLNFQAKIGVRFSESGMIILLLVSSIIIPVFSLWLITILRKKSAKIVQSRSLSVDKNADKERKPEEKGEKND